MTPPSILGIFAALMLLVAAVSAARLLAARRWQRGSLFADTDVAHLLMGMAMAGMLASSLSTLPNTAWVVTFAVMTAWFAFRVAVDARANGVRALAGGHRAPHLLHCGAMTYMFAALAAPAAAGSGMSGMGGASGAAMQTLRYPTLACVLALILIGYSVWDINQPSGSTAASAVAARPEAAGSAGGGPGTAARGLLLSPAVRVGSRIAMGITMALMMLLII